MNLENVSWNKTSSSGKQFISFKEYGDNLIKFLNEGDTFLGYFMFWMQDYNKYKKCVTRKYFFKALEDYKTEGDVYNPSENKMVHQVVDIKAGSIACFEKEERDSEFRLRSFHNKFNKVQAGFIVSMKFDKVYNKSKVIEVNYTDVNMIPGATEEEKNLANEIVKSIDGYRTEYTLDRVIRMGITPREVTYNDNGVEKTIMQSFINLAEHTVHINQYYDSLFGTKKIVDGQVVVVDGEQTDYNDKPATDDSITISGDEGSDDELPLAQVEEEAVEFDDIKFGEEETKNPAPTASKVAGNPVTINTEDAPF